MARERSGFGVHALEVWQKSSHVKRQGRIPLEKHRMDAAKKRQPVLGVMEIYLKYSLIKMEIEKLFA